MQYKATMQKIVLSLAALSTSAVFAKQTLTGANANPVSILDAPGSSVSRPGTVRPQIAIASGRAAVTVVSPVRVSWNSYELKVIGEANIAYTRYESRDGTVIIALE